MDGALAFSTMGYPLEMHPLYTSPPAGELYSSSCSFRDLGLALLTSLLKPQNPLSPCEFKIPFSLLLGPQETAFNTLYHHRSTCTTPERVSTGALDKAGCTDHCWMTQWANCKLSMYLRYQQSRDTKSI